jgi:hypothetical protein
MLTNRPHRDDWHAKPRNKKLEIMRRAKTALERYGIDGRLKQKFAPKRVSLPKMPWDK